ncbi:PadR family transcriptional regulator [Geothrix limicola]|uniref:PadR family transcriptional regulator n=1 Tax=Geothrix limicola TaxID=2927978 RepID=A0ABQ5QEA8_9BACT|nr:helix-turn-helix transcriptional regulator [Geothrix limicola]GLH72756.1 PadR family transcriptional regulator [Geothrix limicola]
MAAANRQSRHLPAFLLLALTDGPLHGHAIRAALAERFPGHKIDPGATYRTLQALEEAGEVAFHWDTDSRGPARKVYTLTPHGWERLEFWRSDIEGRLGLLQGFLDHLRRSKARKKTAKG